MKTYKYAVIKGSKVYHVLQVGKHGFVTGYTKCGKGLDWHEEAYYTKPVGRCLCKNCKRGGGMSNYKYATEANSKVYHLLRTETNVFPSGRMKCGKLFGYFSEFYYEKPKGKRLCKTCKRSM